jgi:hypothetical protein
MKAFSILLLSCISTAAMAQDQMTQMPDLSRPNGHHLILGAIAGKWAFQEARRVVKVLGNSQYTEEYFEERDGQLVKVRELVYTKLPEE